MFEISKFVFEQQVQNSSCRKRPVKIFPHNPRLKNSFPSRNLLIIAPPKLQFRQSDIFDTKKNISKFLSALIWNLGIINQDWEGENLQKLTLVKELLNPRLFSLMLKVREVCLYPSLPLDTYEMLKKWHLRGP